MKSEKRVLIVERGGRGEEAQKSFFLYGTKVEESGMEISTIVA